METIAIIFYVIFGILGLILFFKIWGMTNDVRELKSFILSNSPKKEDNSIIEVKEDLGDEKFPPQTLVVEVATGRQMRIKYKLPNGKYKCSYNSGTLVADMDASELVTFEEYQKITK